MAKCSAIAQSGSRCKGIPIDASGLCHAHHPDRVEARRQAGRRGGRRGGRGRPIREIAELRHAIREVVDGVLEESIDRSVGAVAFQGFNTLLKAVETERRVRETEELEQRLEQLESVLERKNGGSSWGSKIG
jgi:hypothetical protein